jgi:Co/Zn/Cd efflux system component
MSDECCAPAAAGANRRYVRILWIALAANAAMFLVEVAASAFSRSSALAADAADFLGDAGNYALSLGALALGGAWVSRAALLKGWTMALYGAGVLAYAAWRSFVGLPPEPYTMGAVAIAALGVNVGVAALLFRYRGGDANMRSVWLCSRNDAIGNLAVLVAAVAVWGSGTVWPDIAVAAVLATLGLASGGAVVARALAELRGAAPAAAARTLEDSGSATRARP